ncbi:MAG: BtrH N-terminal domain-containing protein [Bacteroidales bacterium]|nr:BtrH N-terminal domain-containing protein [Bacteroidales bacterium]
MRIDFDHKMSAHCENGVTSNLLRFYGVDVSEAMVFGMGSGIFFSYLPFLKLNGCPVIAFRPLPGVIFRRISKALGLKIFTKKYSDREKAMTELDENLKKGIPTGMVVGVYDLTYFPPMFRFHFNAHNIVVFGKEGNDYIVSDPVMEQVEKLSYEDLKRVRFAMGLAKPKGKMYYVENIPKEIDLKKSIIKGLKRTVRDNYLVPGPIIGVNGIKYLSKKIRNWPQKYGEKIAKKYVGHIVRMQEEIGTGGAGFRFLFAAFLQEASVIIDSKELYDLSFKMTEVGDKWRLFAVAAGRICKGRQTVETYDTLGDMLLDISISEGYVYAEIRNILKTMNK